MLTEPRFSIAEILLASVAACALVIAILELIFH